MGIYSDVEFDWRGESYRLKSADILACVAEIEDEAVTVFELAGWMQDVKKAKSARVAKAFAILLKHSGCKDIDAQAIHQHAVYGNALSAVGTLLTIMAPPPDMATEKPGASQKKADTPA